MAKKQTFDKKAAAPAAPKSRKVFASGSVIHGYVVNVIEGDEVVATRRFTQMWDAIHFQRAL